MKRNIIFSMVMIIVLLVANISLATDIPTAELTVTTNKITIQNTDEIVEVAISLGNINGLVTTGSNIVLAYEGTLDYDTNMFETVTVKGQNEWTATYEPTTKKIIGDTTNATANTIIAKLTFTLKDNISNGTSGTISINNMVLTDETNEFKLSKTITITSENEKDSKKENQIENNIVFDDNTIKDNEVINTGISTSNNNFIGKVESKNNLSVDTSQAKGSFPKTGLKNIIVLAVLIIIITGAFSLIRYKMIKLK